MYSQNELCFCRFSLSDYTIILKKCICIAIRCYILASYRYIIFIYPNSFLEKRSHFHAQKAVQPRRKFRAFGLIIACRKASKISSTWPKTIPAPMATWHGTVAFIASFLPWKCRITAAHHLACLILNVHADLQLWGGKTWTSESTLGFTGWEPGKS